MRVGVNLLPQNFGDWGRHHNCEWSTPPEKPDAAVYDEEIAFADLVEPLGFDSLWTVEHHFTPYILSTNPLQFLTFFAGRTSKLDFGTQVIVLPWHDPVRVAEEIVMLDNFLQGRKLYIGIGRGTAQLEFEGLRIPRDQSRERFAEGLEVLRKALGQPHFSHDGEFFHIPGIGLRPQPRSTDLLDRLYMSWGSPDSVPIAASLGMKPLIVPQKDWSRHQAEIGRYNLLRIQAGLEAQRPITMLAVYCAETEEEARAGQPYIDEWGASNRYHYQLESDTFKGVKGYEFRAHQAEITKNMSPEELYAYRQKSAPGHLNGTPDEVFAILKDKLEAVGAGELTVTMKFGTMPFEKAERSIRLFSKEVLPRLHELPLPPARVETETDNRLVAPHA
jgi:alkanesulfonate monooxygenase SsuD/methylene tetrahydromethanopterin reductase-like flavin-dependent oxidoreductase (luciferase family)